MKTQMITMVTNTIAKAFSPKKAEAAAEVAIKDGSKMLADGQKAADAQGRAMIGYEAPKMGKVNLDKKNTKAASGFGEISDETIGGGSAGAPAYSQSEWDEAMELVNDISY